MEPRAQLLFGAGFGGLGLKVWGLSLGARGDLGCNILGLGFRNPGLGFKVQGLGFRVWYLNLEVRIFWPLRDWRTLEFRDLKILAVRLISGSGQKVFPPGRTKEFPVSFVFFTGIAVRTLNHSKLNPPALSPSTPEPSKPLPSPCVLKA